MDSDTLLTEKEAAKRLLAKPMTLAKWRYRNRGPIYLRLSGKVRYRLADIQTFIEQSRVDPAAKPKRRKRSRAA